MDHGNSWRVNESLLQSYRSIFISSQSFLLGVGAYIAKWEPLFFLAIFAIAQYIIWFVWKEVVRSRSYIVDFHKFQVTKPLPFNVSESEYVHDSTLRDKANQEFGIKSNIRKTRQKMDVILPNLYSVIWLGIAIVAFLPTES